MNCQCFAIVQNKFGGQKVPPSDKHKKSQVCNLANRGEKKYVGGLGPMFAKRTGSNANLQGLVVIPKNIQVVCNSNAFY